MDSPDHLLQEPKPDTWKRTLLLAFQSLGVVYGHLSIGPMFVFPTLLPDEIESEEILYQLLSFIFWTLTLIPLLKYAIIMLMADDNGEGGTFALYSLLCRHAKVSLLPSNPDEDELLAYGMGSAYKDKSKSNAKSVLGKNKNSRYILLLMAVFGSCSVIRCGVMVPTISVFSASLGFHVSLEKASKNSSEPSEQHLKYLPTVASCVILMGLFVLQNYGTNKIGFLFAPIIVVWLLFISGIGIYNIFHWNTGVLVALSPEYMYQFIKKIDVKNWRSLGGVMLCMAGSEAMFANLGHLSKRSIKIAFGLLVYPCLIFCYMGQTAFISKNWESQGIPLATHLASSVPGPLYYFFVGLSLLASIIGSQATITATFSIINQCMALSCFPRMKVVHTSHKIHGQVYIPDINWILMILCLFLTLGIEQMNHIGNAIGLTIIIGMLITTCFMTLIIAIYWNRMLMAVCFMVFFGSIEAIYLLGCVLSMRKDAWCITIFIQILLIIMLAWHYGSMKKYEFDILNKVPIEWLTDLGPNLGVLRVPGIAFVCTDITKGIPSFFSHFVTNLPAFHQILVFVSLKPMPIPYVPSSRQLLIGRMGSREYRVYRCIVRYGYCDNIGDINEFEDQIIHGIGEFISQDDGSSESFCSLEERGEEEREEGIVVSGNLYNGKALITVAATDALDTCWKSEDVESPREPIVRRKRVHFLLPPETPEMNLMLREELQELVDAREHGTTYVLGRPQFCARRDSKFLRRFVIEIFIFLARNCREPSLVLNIPHAAHLEVSTSCSI